MTDQQLKYGVVCQRITPLEPEAYVCAVKDANTLVLGLLDNEGKGGRWRERAPEKGAQGIIGKPYAIVTVLPPLESNA